MKTQKSKIAILVLNQISAVFPIVLFPGDQKTAQTGESLNSQIVLYAQVTFALKVSQLHSATRTTDTQ